MEQIRISGKELGQIALKENFCPRCFWLKMHCNKKLPFQIFPGIFSSIDTYSKKITNLYFEQYRQTPAWFREFGELGEPIKPPSPKMFMYSDPDNNILLTGMPDEMFKTQEGSYYIVDYKTARITERQDSLLPMYEVQLNSYAFIGEKCGYQPIAGLALVYYEPKTDITKDDLDRVVREEGFHMNFSAKLVPIKLETERIPLLLRQVREIYDQKKPPEGRIGCEDCRRVDAMIALMR